MDWVKIKKVYIGTEQVRPKVSHASYYSEEHWNEFQSLVSSVGSVQFQDSTKRFRFQNWCYIWNRIAVDVDWSNFRKINLDTLSVVSTVSTTANGRIWYFGDNRILTRVWILDFNWTVITSFSQSFNSITPWLPGVVRANVSYDIYKWIVDWDNITFTKVGTWWSDQSAWQMSYWRLWAYLINYNDTSGSWNSSYVNPSTNAITNFTWWDNSRQDLSVSWSDWKLYRIAVRNNGFWKLQKIWTWSEWFVGSSLSTNWTQYWRRFGKFLWNIVSWGMNTSSGTWNWYWSNSYFIATDWTLTLAQSNAFAYDTNIYGQNWFIDENWWLYPSTGGGWSGVILKTDKTFTNLNWKNPYLWR